MNNFNQKQKIILGILITIILGAIGYYVYGKEDNTEQLEIQNNIEVQTEDTQKEEEYSDTLILVHVSGAVSKEGVIELKAGSRIAEAIEKARWAQR